MICCFSLRNLHKRLLAGEIIEKRPNDMEKLCERTCWNDNPDVVSAVWVLVDLCSSNEASTMSGLLADFISRVSDDLYLSRLRFSEVICVFSVFSVKFFFYHLILDAGWNR